MELQNTLNCVISNGFIREKVYNECEKYYKEKINKMDDLIKLCDKLENCSKNEICYKNKIVCTKAVLQSYINGDENKRLKLKAQIKQYEKGIYESMTETLSQAVAVAALATSCISLIVSVTNKDIIAVDISVFVLILLSIVLMVVLIAKWGINKFGYRDKWKKYIEVVLDDMEKEKECE